MFNLYNDQVFVIIHILLVIIAILNYLQKYYLNLFHLNLSGNLMIFLMILMNFIIILNYY
jgi:hypothetical protein